MERLQISRKATNISESLWQVGAVRVPQGNPRPAKSQAGPEKSAVNMSAMPVYHTPLV